MCLVFLRKIVVAPDTARKELTSGLPVTRPESARNAHNAAARAKRCVPRVPISDGEIVSPFIESNCVQAGPSYLR
jgi:hypothetical protein